MSEDTIAETAQATEPRRHLHAVDTPPNGIPVYGTPDGPGLGAGHLEAATTEPPPEDTDTPINSEPVALTEDERLAAAKAVQVPPILPAWLSSWETFTSTARWAAAHYTRRVARRIVRTVLVDSWRWTGWAVKGTGRVVWTVTRWVADIDGHPLMGQVQAESDRAYVRMSEDRSRRQRARLIVTATLLVLSLISAALVRYLAPWYVGAGLAFSVFVALVLIGKPADKRLLSGPMVPKVAQPRLTDRQIALALGSLGIPQLAGLLKNERTSELFASQIERVGPGWRARLTMPVGVAAAELIEKRAKIAAGLRRPIGAVWLSERREEHAGAVELWVLDQPFSRMRTPAWPLAAAGRADMLKAIPFGHTQDLQKATVTLFESNWLTGGVPGAGKTAAMLVLACAAALDPRCELYLVELKGSDDYTGLKQVAHRHVTGPARREDLEATMCVLREVYEGLEARALTLAEAVRSGKAPDRRVTPELASAKIGLHPLVLILDEIQELFAEKEYAGEAEELLKGIIKRGRALAVMVAMGTQSPDAKSLPKSIERLIGTRFALRVEGQPGNDMILGTSAYQGGHRATLFDETDRGVGLLKIGTNVRTVRSSYLSAEVVESIGKRARVLRENADTLSGDAIGQYRSTAEDDPIRVSILADSIEAWESAGGGDAVHLIELERALIEAFPNRYADRGEQWAGSALRALGVAVRAQLNRAIPGSDGERANRAGVDRVAILKVLASTDSDEAASRVSPEM